MKKLILLLIILITVLLTSCENKVSSQLKITTIDTIKPFIIKDIRGNQWDVKEYNSYPNIDEINFTDIDGTKVVIHGNYSIIKYK